MMILYQQGRTNWCLDRVTYSIYSTLKYQNKFYIEKGTNGIYLKYCGSFECMNIVTSTNIYLNKKPVAGISQVT